MSSTSLAKDQAETDLNPLGTAASRTAVLLAQWVILSVALVIRLVVLSRGPYHVFPDETFQYLEYGHYFTHGSGVLPWEFFQGIRSYFLPGIVAGILAVHQLLGATDPQIYVYVIRMLCILLSLSVVYIGFRLGLRTFGLGGSIVTGSVCAVWFELIYFAPALLTEVLGSHVALWGFYLLGSEKASRRRLVLAGALLGLAVTLRFHLAPGLLAGVAWQLRSDMRGWKAVILGGGATLLVFSGVLDLLTLGLPFQSIWYNFWLNATGVSTSFGTSPWDSYLGTMVASWTRVAWPLAVLAVLGAVRLPALSIAALAVLLSHMLVGHKEYRFVYFTLMTMPILIGVGACALLNAFAVLRRERWFWITRGAFIALVAATSGFGATYGEPAGRFALSRNNFAAFFAAHRASDFCGLGVIDVFWPMTGGYSYLNRDLPLYYSTYAPAIVGHGMEVMLQGNKLEQYAGSQILKETGRFNYALVPRGASLPGYRTTACFADPESGDPVCLQRREGACQ